MSKRRSTPGGAPTMSAAEQAETFAELDQLHGHCLSLIATCTQLGKDLRDTELLKHVANLSELVSMAERLNGRLADVRNTLTDIRTADTSLRTGTLGANNIMVVLNVSQRYEDWLNRFGRGVAPTMESMCSIIEAARAKMNATIGSNA